MKKHVYLSLLVILLIIAVIFVLTRGGNEATETIDTVSLHEEELEDNQVFSEKKDMIVTINTNFGVIALDLYENLAPNTVANFVKLTNKGFYNGTKFHRVINNFMIQGGDPLSADDSQEARWGTGGPGYTFADEIHLENKNAVGTISMANAGPDTNGSQFFINTADNNFLNEKHTVFGRVINGMDVVDAIQNTKTLPGDRPVEPVVIEKITVSEK